MTWGVGGVVVGGSVGAVVGGVWAAVDLSKDGEVSYGVPSITVTGTTSRKGQLGMVVNMVRREF
jgi:hypothetical protein